MIETYNNIIFWIGCLSVFGLFLVCIISSYFYIHEILMNRGKWYFTFIFNNALEKRLKNVNKKDFDAWQKSQLEQWQKYHKNDTHSNIN